MESVAPNMDVIGTDNTVETGGGAFEDNMKNTIRATTNEPSK